MEEDEVESIIVKLSNLSASNISPSRYLKPPPKYEDAVKYLHSAKISLGSSTGSLPGSNLSYKSLGSTDSLPSPVATSSHEHGKPSRSVSVQHLPPKCDQRNKMTSSPFYNENLTKDYSGRKCKRKMLKNLKTYSLDEYEYDVETGYLLDDTTLTAGDKGLSRGGSGSSISSSRGINDKEGRCNSSYSDFLKSFYEKNNKPQKSHVSQSLPDISGPDLDRLCPPDPKDIPYSKSIDQLACPTEMTLLQPLQEGTESVGAKLYPRKESLLEVTTESAKMHLESPFCPMQSETFAADINCEFTSPISPRRESCDSISLEQFAFTPPQHDTYYPSYQEKSSLMSATTAISGALEELQSETYLPTDEWSQTLDTFLTSLQQQDVIPDLFANDNRHSHDSCQFRDRLPFNSMNDVKDNISQIEDIEKYLSPSRVSPMTISPKEISFQQYDEEAFGYKQINSPKLSNHFNFSNGNTQKCLHALQEISSQSFTLSSNMSGGKPKHVVDEVLMESVNDNCGSEATLYQMTDEPSFRTYEHSLTENFDPNSSQMEKKEEEKTEQEEVDGPRVCRWVDCNNTFANRESLSRHIERSHVDQRKGDDYTCFWAACQRRYRPFNARYKLLIHMRVHSGEKPNKCTYKGCTKAFSRLENLKIHMRSHTGERPYICVYSRCGKAFSNSSDRAKHQRTHINAKPYVCSVPGCKKCYTDPSSLRKHVKNHTVKEQALAKRKASDSYLTSANYTTSTYNSTDCESTLASIKSENDESSPSSPRDVVRFSLLCHVLGRRPSQELQPPAIIVPQFTQEELDTWVST